MRISGPGGSNQAEELFGPLGYEVAYERREGEYRADPGIAVASRLSLHGRSTSWTDAFAVAGEGRPHTWSTDNPYVAPFAEAVFAEAVFAEPDHHRRIDYDLVGSPFTWRPRVVVRSAREALTGDPRAAPSDHWGVLADLDLDGITLGGGRGLDTWEDTARLLWPDQP